jgi:hypothetical protein
VLRCAALCCAEVNTNASCIEFVCMTFDINQSAWTNAARLLQILHDRSLLIPPQSTYAYSPSSFCMAWQAN